MAECLLSLGSNQGDRQRTLLSAFSEIALLSSTSVVARSRLRETPPIGGPSRQPCFVNAAVRLTTSLSPQALLKSIQLIESKFGRERCGMWSARTLDIDLLLYGQCDLRTASLCLPHPRMAYRRFVLEPANDVASWMRHPTSKWTIAQLLNHLNQAWNYAAVAAADHSAQVWMIEELARCFAGKTKPVDQSLVRSTDEKAVSIIPLTPWDGTYREFDASHACRPKSSSLISDRPKLIIALITPPSVNEQSYNDKDAPTGSLRCISGVVDLVRSEQWRTRLNLPATGPVAWIDARDRDLALRVATAAMQATWPELA